MTRRKKAAKKKAAKKKATKKKATKKKATKKKTSSRVGSLDRLKVMISSRCNDEILSASGDAVALTEVRRQIKQELEAATVFERNVFEVWINEDATAQAGTDTSWQECIKQVDRADLVIVLFNGDAGWRSSSIGICHAELERALKHGPAKVRLVRLLPMAKNRTGADRKADDRFRAYVGEQNLFSPGANNSDEVVARCRELAAEALVELARTGAREVRRGRYHTGQALAWSRLDFLGRKKAIEDVVLDGLESQDTARRGTAERSVSVELGSHRVLLCVHAVPAAMSVAAARELVGQPFLRDHLLVADLSVSVGPLHLVACHRGITETQARGLLGQPDVTVVSAPFGVFAADEVQKSQLLFLANCRDDSSTRHSLQRALEWLGQTQEGERVGVRAAGRARIVTAIASEFSE